jgi:hypothetical protein
LLAPEDATLHYGLVKRIEAGEVQWLKRSFKEEDLTTLGRAEVDGVVDAVFVTAGGKHGSSKYRVTVQRLLLTRHSHPNLKYMSKTTDTGQCCRRTEPLFLHAPFYTLGRSSANWHHNFWKGMQTFCEDPKRDCILASPTSG